MELSNEVHGLLERIKKLSERAKISGIYSNSSIDVTSNAKNVGLESDITCEEDDLILVHEMDFSDVEHWLLAADWLTPFTGDLRMWLRQDFEQKSKPYPFISVTDLEKSDLKKLIDTRTFTRPKKRLSRPTLEQFTKNCFRNASADNCVEDSRKLSDPLNIPTQIQFKLSEPVYNNNFDRMYATASPHGDSFQNMSPPSLINSLCSSTFTTLMDSSYTSNLEQVPNENYDPNVTYEKNDLTVDIQSKHNDTFSIETTYPNDLNLTYQKTKSKDENVNNLKASCPEINRPFKKLNDYRFDETFQKLSDSEPNLIKRTILNQSMELMHPTIDVTYRNLQSGSADSLDERSSSVSNSSKESTSKIMNTNDLDHLAKMQEHSLRQVMSTPNTKHSRLSLWEEGAMSPIQTNLADDPYLSDSDLSDTCVTARTSASPKPNEADVDLVTNTNCLNVTRLIPKEPEVSQSTNIRTLPTMIVKPMKPVRTIMCPKRVQSVPVSSAVRPTLQSGLPRPVGARGSATGIPRFTSRIPAPKIARPQSSRPAQRPLPRNSDWMDGCY